MKRSVNIKLGNLEFTAHTLNLGQAEDLADIISEFANGGLKQKIGAARAIVLSAIQRERPDADDALVRSLEATPAELMGAVTEIMRISGYARGAAPGEAVAAPVVTEAA